MFLGIDTVNNLYDNANYAPIDFLNFNKCKIKNKTFCTYVIVVHVFDNKFTVLKTFTWVWTFDINWQQYDHVTFFVVW